MYIVDSQVGWGRWASPQAEPSASLNTDDDDDDDDDDVELHVLGCRLT